MLIISAVILRLPRNNPLAKRFTKSAEQTLSPSGTKNLTWKARPILLRIVCTLTKHPSSSKGTLVVACLEVRNCEEDPKKIPLPSFSRKVEDLDVETLFCTGTLETRWKTSSTDASWRAPACVASWFQELHCSSKSRWNKAKESQRPLPSPGEVRL